MGPEISARNSRLVRVHGAVSRKLADSVHGGGLTSSGALGQFFGHHEGLVSLGSGEGMVGSNRNSGLTETLKVP